jgi:hypothetical protein
MFNVMMFHQVYGGNPSFNQPLQAQPTGGGKQATNVRRARKKYRKKGEVPGHVHARDITESDNSTVTSNGTSYCQQYGDLCLPLLPYHDGTDDDAALFPRVPKFLNDCLECPNQPYGTRSMSWKVKKGSIRPPFKSYQCHCRRPYVIRAVVDENECWIKLQAPLVDGIPQLPHPHCNGEVEISNPTNPILDGSDSDGRVIFTPELLEFINYTYDEEPLLSPSSLWLRIRAHVVMKELLLNTNENFRALVRLMKSLSWMRRNPTGSASTEGICDNNSLLQFVSQNCITKSTPETYVKVDPLTVHNFSNLCHRLYLDPDKMYTLQLPKVAKKGKIRCHVHSHRIETMPHLDPLSVSPGRC